MSQDKTQTVDTKKMIEVNSEKKTKIKFNDRVELEIVSDKMRHFKKGDKVKVHRIVAEQYVSDKLAKEVK